MGGAVGSGQPAESVKKKRKQSRLTEETTWKTPVPLVHGVSLEGGGGGGARGGHREADPPREIGQWRFSNDAEGQPREEPRGRKKKRNPKKDPARVPFKR